MPTTAVRMTLAWRVTKAEAASIMSALQRLMVRTRSSPGCTSCSLSTDIGDRVGVRCVADWESEADLRTHIRSADFAQLAELLEHGTDAPTIEFALPAGTRGFEYAEKVRRQHTRG